MAATVTYTNFGGMLVHEDRGGTERQYVPDPLGSLAGELDSSQAFTYRSEYWPYGEVQAETGSNTSPWSFVGLLGYLKDLAFLLYVRSRHFSVKNASWITTDPLWPSEKPYVYAASRPNSVTDRLGLAFWDFAKCAKEWERYKNCLAKLNDTWAKYNPWTDCKGGIPYGPGKITKPFGHWLKILAYQKCVLSALKNLHDNCGGVLPIPIPLPGPESFNYPWRLPSRGLQGRRRCQPCLPEFSPQGVSSSVPVGQRCAEVASTGIATGGLLYCGWELLKWGIAVAAAPETGGASIIIAEALP